MFRKSKVFNLLSKIILKELRNGMVLMALKLLAKLCFRIFGEVGLTLQNGKKQLEFKQSITSKLCLTTRL